MPPKRVTKVVDVQDRVTKRGRSNSATSVSSNRSGSNTDNELKRENKRTAFSSPRSKSPKINSTMEKLTPETSPNRPSPRRLKKSELADGLMDENNSGHSKPESSAAVLHGSEEDVNESDHESTGDSPADDEDEEEEEEEEEEEVIEKKVLPSRSTRGYRSGELVGDAAEADEAFWGQAAFADDESDTDVSSSDLEDPGSETSTDSDIDLPESDEESGKPLSKAGAKAVARARAGVVDDEDDTKKKKKGYLDPALRGSSSIGIGRKGINIASIAAAHLAKTNAANAGTSTLEENGIGEEKVAEKQIVDPGDRSLRRSTQDKVIASLQTREEELQLQKATPVVPVAPPEPLPSFIDVLIDAAHTTVDNLRFVDVVTKTELDQKAKDAELGRSGLQREHPPGSVVLRYHSRRGMPTTLTFCDVDSVPSVINTSSSFY